MYTSAELSIATITRNILLSEMIVASSDDARLGVCSILTARDSPSDWIHYLNNSGLPSKMSDQNLVTMANRYSNSIEVRHAFRASFLVTEGVKNAYQMAKLFIAAVRDLDGLNISHIEKYFRGDSVEFWLEVLHWVTEDVPLAEVIAKSQIRKSNIDQFYFWAVKKGYEVLRVWLFHNELFDPRSNNLQEKCISMDAPHVAIFAHVKANKTMLKEFQATKSKSKKRTAESEVVSARPEKTTAVGQ